MKNPVHQHFHCKNLGSAERRKKRLVLLEGWSGKIEPGKSGFILTLVERIPEEFRRMVL